MFSDRYNITNLFEVNDDHAVALTIAVSDFEWTICTYSFLDVKFELSIGIGTTVNL